MIRIPYEEVEGNTAVMVEQWGEEYLLHVISSDRTNYEDIGHLLKDFLRIDEKTQGQQN